jgi:diguanylate cyclase (GGDEF)-like protein/PAS domain S-box-containing protein
VKDNNMTLATGTQIAGENDETIKQLKLADTFFNHSVSCLVILDRDYNFIRVNEAYAKACKRDVMEFAGRNHFDLYPSDAKLIFDEVVRSKRPFVTFTRAFEFVDQPERGVTYWDWTLVPVLDAQGEIEYLVFSLVEVTERKRAEEALRVAALVYQHSSEAMMVTNAANNIVSINSAFTRLTGYSAGEVLGKNPKLLQSGRQSEEFYRAMWNALETTGRWHGELWDQRKNGELVAFRLSIDSVRDDAGKLDRRIALFSDITEEKRTEALIWEQANFDGLTKLPNRQMFYGRLQEHIDNAAKAGTALSILLIDLDQFKEINDTLGHSVGDLMLIGVARRVAACVKESVMLARMGGDEFAVILSDQSDIDNIDLIARKIIQTLTEPFQLGAETAFISASIGIALFPADGTTLEELMRHSDQAMYAAKNEGRNRFCYYTSALQDAAISRVRMTNDLRGALAGNQFEVHYQAITDLVTGSVSKAEALIRWRHPTRGMISPVEFIPLAESSGMILEIGEWVFRQSAEQACRLRAQGHQDFQISVNVSPVQFRNDRELHKSWLKHLWALNLPPQSIVIEITEGLLLDLTADVKDKLLAFRDSGIQVSLDDFGTGYSSLAYLNKFDIDFLKIDRVFVNNLETKSQDRTLCEAIIVMAHKLGLKVIAEGVETERQRDFLVTVGCDFAQGFLFSKPLPAAQFETFLQSMPERRLD